MPYPSDHNLAAIQRKLVEEDKVKTGIEFYVLSNPAEMVRLPAEANGNNTIFIHMSRSGETGETIKTLEFLRARFPKCIICANKGPLQQLAEKFNLFNLPFGEDEVKIGGRMMRRKTITGYAALWLSLGGNEKYFDEYVKEADKCDNLLSFLNGEESLAVQMGEFMHSAAVLSGRPRLILMLNDDMTNERFTGEKQFLKHSLYELVQLWSEGYGKEDNYAPLEFINYSQDKEALSGIMAQADSCCGLVVLDKKNKNYNEAKGQADAMTKVMPLVIIEIEGMNFKTAAALSSLYEDVITFMCTCENVDINANPGVKAVREESGRVLAGEEEKEAGIEEAAAKQIGKIITIGEVKADASLLAFAGQIDGLAKSLKIDIPELLKIYQDSLDNYNLFLNILEKAGGIAYQRAVALLEANDSFGYVVKGYKEVRTERQAKKEREVPGQVQELVKEIQGDAGKYNISLDLGAVKIDEKWLGERRKLHRGLREGDKDVLAQELAEFMDIAINTPDSKIGDIATVVSDIFQQDLGNKFKHSWMNSVAPAQDIFNELHIFTRASHHTFETILDNPEGYFFFGLVAQKQKAPENRQDLKWLFEKVLEKDDVENPKHAGLNVGEMNRRLAKANYTSLWRKGLPGLSIEFEKLTTEEEELGELFEKTAEHYRNILKEATLVRFAKAFPDIEKIIPRLDTGGKFDKKIASIMVETLNGTEITGAQNGKKYYLNASLPYPASPDWWEVKVYCPDLRDGEKISIEIGKIVGIATDEPEERIGIFISNMAIDKEHRQQDLVKGIIEGIAKIVSQGSILEAKIREIETLKDLYFHIIYEKGFSLPEMFKQAPGKINELIKQIEELNDKIEPSRALGSKEPAEELVEKRKEAGENLKNWLVSIIGNYLIDNQIEFDTLKETILGKIWINAGFRQKLHIYSVMGDFPAVFIKGEKVGISDFKSFWAEVFPYINVQLNKENLTEPMAFIIDPALIGDNPSTLLAVLNLKEQLGDKIKIVFQHSPKSEKLGRNALYETIKEATDGAVDLKGKVDWDAPATASPEEIIEGIQKKFEDVGSIRIIGRQDWAKGFQNIERPGLEKITLVVCKIGEEGEAAQGDLAVLLSLKDTGLLPKKEMMELNRRWGKGGNFFIVETKEIAEKMEYIKKYREALEKFE